MPSKIKMQKGYPTSDKKMFDTYKEAVSHQAKIDLDEAVDKCEGTTTTADFIKKNHEAVSEYIKYHCKPKATPKARKPATKEKKETPAQV